MRRIRGLLLPLGALLVAVGALLRWWSAGWTRPLLGEQRDSVTGTAAAPALLVFTLAAIAGWAAAAGTKSAVVRRGIGVLIVVIGAAVCWVAVSTASGGPRSVILERHPEAAEVGAASLIVWGPILAVLGGLLLAAAGVVILLRRGARGIGARFERPGTVRRSSRAAAPPATAPSDGTIRNGHPEDDAAQLWKGLDAGDDPTALDGTGSAAR